MILAALLASAVAAQAKPPPPVLNPYTRIAVEMNPARGIIRAVGYELHDGEEFARPVTQVREFSAEAVAA